MRRGTPQSLKLFFVVCFFLAPLSASAHVEITEVMYDADGSDSGREWVEITNTGGMPEDLTGYKFLEGGVNHTLSVAAGTSTLAAGESAIISNNTEKFRTYWPSYTGTLFKSSFSLSNTGETLVIKNKTEAEDTASYSSDTGAAGDGNSLHKSAGAFVAGAPNPGSTAATSPIVKAKSALSTTKKTTKSSKSVSAAATPPRTFTGSTLEPQNSVAAVPVAPKSTNTLLTTSLSLCGLIVLGVAGVLFVRPEPKVAETSIMAEEFEIEG